MKKNTQHAKKVLFTLFAMLMPLLIDAQVRVEIDGIWYRLITKDKVAEVTYNGTNYNEYSKYSGFINIPPTITYGGEQYNVTSIGSHAFDGGCWDLTSVTIPESVTSIGNYAFNECSKLAVINIPEEVTSIGDYAFNGCYSLTSIGIPESVTSIGRYAFCCCSFTTINIPKGVTSIEECTFDRCRSLTNITIPEGVTNIGGWAFYCCEKLTAITIPASVTSIGKRAFSGCESLTSIIVAEGNTIYDSREGCNAIIETDINSLVAGSSATIIPKGVTCIGDDAFTLCSTLTYIDIPESVTSIGDNAFYCCNRLTTITIPENVTNIGNTAFEECRGLTAITCKAAIPPTIAKYTFRNVDKSIPLYTPTSSVEVYKSISYWNEFTNIIGGALEKCATPTISYADGQLLFTCETEGATIKSSVRDYNIGDHETAIYNIVPTYTITAYATKEQYDDSEVATLTLCWIPCDGQHMTTETTSIPSKPVPIQSQGGTITLSGLADDTEVAAYNLAGDLLDETTATDDTATLTTNLNQGDVVILKIGNNSIKIVIR